MIPGTTEVFRLRGLPRLKVYFSAMKKFYSLFMLLVAVSCTDRLAQEAAGEMLSLVFRASHENEITKTSLGTGNGICWSTSDQVTIFSGTGVSGTSFRVSSTESEGSIATFEGLTAASSNGYYYALFPAQASARLVTTGGTLQATLPTVQTGVENSFAADANLSLARVDSDAVQDNQILHFKNAGALLSFLVPGNYVTRVRIESRDGSVAMTGPANIDYNAGAPKVAPTSAAKNYVEVNVPSGSIGKRYYAVVYPGNYSQGFDVTFYTSSNAFNRYSSSMELNLSRNSLVRLIDKNWGVNDDRSSKTVSGTELIAPTISSGGAVSATSASISFSCTSGKRDTYKFYRRDASSMGSGTLAGTLNTGSGQYGGYSYTFTGLATGASYDFGVSAACTGESGYGDSPITWLEDVTINAAVSGMSVTVDSAAETYYNFVVNYTLEGLTSTAVEHGLIFSYSSATPTCGLVGVAGKLPGPTLASTGTVSLSQCVPNAVLRPGEICYLRAYCYDETAGNYVYSTVQQLTLKAQPEGLPVSRTAQTSPSAAIGLYSFTAGGSYNGYYAVADCSSSSPVRLGVNNAQLGTTSALSMASQLASSGALVLVNGQIFGAQGNLGLAYMNGTLRYNNSSDDGIAACRMYGNSYSTSQPVTRAILGVDADGTPGAWWCSLLSGTPYFFDRPIPAGTAVYPQVSASSGPGPKQSWSPEEALSTGPMLLYDGKVCVSEDKLKTGVYYTNYELWETTAGNIYGSSRQRTAIGYDDTGKVYLVVVTSGVTLTQLARIMKGLGCTHAMNLDGGGSTQMQVSGQGALTGNTRNVKSTVGFFAK